MGRGAENACIVHAFHGEPMSCRPPDLASSPPPSSISLPDSFRICSSNQQGVNERHPLRNSPLPPLPSTSWSSLVLKLPRFHCYRPDTSTASAGTPPRLLNLRAQNDIRGNISSLFLGIPSPGLSHFTYSTRWKLCCSRSIALFVMAVSRFPAQIRTGVGDLPLEAGDEDGRGPPIETTPPNSDY